MLKSGSAIGQKGSKVKRQNGRGMGVWISALLFFCSVVLLFFCSFFVWFFAIPDNMVKDFVEDSISRAQSTEHRTQSIKVSIEGLRKGFFFTIYVDSLVLKIGKTNAFRITDISSRINPLYLLKKRLAFSIKGKIGRGVIDGSFKLPGDGNMKITNVEINAIPYMTSIGLKGDGFISGSIDLKNNTVDVIFEIPEADIEGSVTRMPIPLSLFHKIQGAFSIKGTIVEVNSITLEGEKGYARLKGDVTIEEDGVSQGFMNLTLELMPSASYLSSTEFKSLESILMKYHVSPGYYVIPIEGSLL